jgi:hypothetical protein
MNVETPRLTKIKMMENLISQIPLQKVDMFIRGLGGGICSRTLVSVEGASLTPITKVMLLLASAGGR